MPRIAAIIQREEYDSFAKLIGHDPEFPKTYDAWLEGMTKENKQRRAHGETINEVVIHPQEFAEWCKARARSRFPTPRVLRWRPERNRPSLLPKIGHPLAT